MLSTGWLDLPLLLKLYSGRLGDMERDGVEIIRDVGHSDVRLREQIQWTLSTPRLICIFAGNTASPYID